MKRILQFSVVLFLNSLLPAQTLVNSSFETWTITPYEDPAGWTSSNTRDFQKIGAATVTKVTGQSGFALRIETKITPAGEGESYMLSGPEQCDNPENWTGGVPYSQQPQALTGHYRYNLPGNDTALIIVAFSKNGAQIGFNLIKVRGTGSQPAFAGFSHTLACNGTPDSVIIAATSSNKMTNIGVSNGSFIELDNLAFTGATQPIPNGNFETWTAKSYDKPGGWSISGKSVSRTAAAQAGSYAISLETVYGDCSGPSAAEVTNGRFTENSGPKGGVPYTKMTDTLCGYYKYTAATGDKGEVNVNLSKNGSIVGGNTRTLQASASWQYFELPFSAAQTPDSIRIDIRSSQWPVNVTGSKLVMDNLYFKSQPAGLAQRGGAVTGPSVYPNPVNDVLYIRSADLQGGQVLHIYDAIGKMMLEEVLEGQVPEFGVNVSDLASGIYYFEIAGSAGNKGTGRFIRE